MYSFRFRRVVENSFNHSMSAYVLKYDELEMKNKIMDILYVPCNFGEHWCSFQGTCVNNALYC